jgi:hypothetical protein
MLNKMTEIKNVNSPQLHEWYILKTDAQLKVIEKELQTNTASRKVIVNLISEHKTVIELCCNYSYDELITTSNFLVLYHLKFDLSRVNLTQNNVNVSSITSLVNILIKTNKLIKTSTQKLIELQNSAVAFCVYKDAIDTFNIQLVDKILEGYSFNIGHNLRTIRIIKKERKRANINWNESNKVKALLIEQGKTPYNKETAPDGEKWLVYFTSDCEYWWYWNKSTPVPPYPNYRVYSFVPTRDAKIKLRQTLNSNTYAHLNYSE